MTRAAIVALVLLGSGLVIAQDRPRARQLGLAPGVYPPGPENAITDVAGVRVGHTTLVDGDAVRTGVTAVLPHAGDLFQEKVAGTLLRATSVTSRFGTAEALPIDRLRTLLAPAR